ncbi:TetR/AcrR family transcriptional regulator [Glaciihabitans arcticus]|uniref:TetR/AcrR family transcriptional regulator n=2 Tax=Glaciihabitans arcticus TaxID=2668039 RepID=A0A4Q9GUK9_9MICO|nr:TetR/AcrR family transcriptional regulator [Glaciihabitans arcticus]
MMAPSDSGPGRRRNEHSHRAILGAAITLVADRGFENVTVESIASHAGVGKQTIYRWWRSKGEVVLEAINDGFADVAAFPNTGDIIADLRTQMENVTVKLATSDFGSAYRGLIAAAQSDPELARKHIEQIIEPASVACRKRLIQARDMGQIRSDADVQSIIDLLYGAIYYRLLLSTRPLATEQVAQAIDLVFDGIRGTG